MSFGVGEIIVIVFVLVVVFSAARMGQLGNAVGKFVYSFKKASKGEGFVDAGRGTTRLPGRKSGSGGQDDEEDAQIIEGEKKP